MDSQNQQQQQKKSMMMVKVSLPKTGKAIRSVLVAGAQSRKAISRVIQAKYDYMKIKMKSPTAVPRKLGIKALGKEEDLRPLLDVLREMWNSPVVDLPVAKDIGRLARRVEIVDEATGKVMFSGMKCAEELAATNIANADASATADGSSSSSTSASANTQRQDDQILLSNVVVKMVLTIAKIVEPGRVGELETAFTETLLPKFKGSSDLILLCEELVSILGGDSSPTVRVLKTIQQEIVLHCTFALKEQMTKKYFTKDVRTPDGWRIVVSASPDKLQIVHIRKEQSLDQNGDVKNHWEFQWELRMVFPITVSELQSAQLRVTDLFLSETMDKGLEDDLRKTIVGDVLIA